MEDTPNQTPAPEQDVLRPIVAPDSVQAGVKWRRKESTQSIIFTNPPTLLQKRILWGLGLPLYFVVSFCLGLLMWAGHDMPDTSPLWAPKSTPQIIILDRHGREILKTGGLEAKPVILSELPQILPQALIAVEDKRYYHHIGFDVIGLARAFTANAKAGHVVQGGSTLTQQLAKNVFLTRKQTLKRKAQEIILAVWLEHRLTKREILETYLSRVYFGGGTVGIESGSMRFFNKPAAQLKLGEAAMLAGILQAPDRLNPVKNRKASAVRTAEVLSKLEAQNYLDAQTASLALTTAIEIEPVQIKTLPSAQYFTDWILSQVDEIIGAPKHNIVVRTTLDMAAQRAAQTAVRAGVNTDRNAQQAALIAFDGVGGVRAMVGGASYLHSPYNRSVRAKRQPGSAFKPFVYLAALEAGAKPWDIRADAPLDIDGWQPGNFSNKFLGEISLEKALALSINTVAIVLAEEVGRQQIVNTAAKMGLPGFKPYASLALGAQETTLYDLTAAYLPFANWGHSADVYGLEAIYDASGEILFERKAMPQQRIISSEILGQMNLMLQTVVQAGTGRAARIEGRDIAGKTGTTNDYRDAWFVGYTADYVAGVWVGNDDNSKMSRITGGNIPARIWKNFMTEALKDTPHTKLPTSVRPPPVLNVMRSQNLPPQKSLETLLADVEKALP